MKTFIQISLILLSLNWFGTIIHAEEIPVVSERSIGRSIEKALKKIPQVKSVNKLKSIDHFDYHYEIWFEQLTDPNNTASESFLQRVILGHVDADLPVIVELQGYEINRLSSGELASRLNANQLIIEHRYFAESKPDSGIPWQTLTVENAAYDQHIIINAIKSALYKNSKFISTGISKGGQTTMIHRSIYPDDVDGSVCYVAPLNFEREDKRIYDFLKNVSTQEERQKVKDFQVLCFERKDSLLSLLKELASEQGYAWDVNYTKAFELYVLEYSFAFWQWGSFEVDQIPTSNSTNNEVLNHLLLTSGISFFEKQGVEKLRPFFWAALTQMGIYGYEYEPFKKYLSEQRDYTFDFTFPEGLSAEFDPTPMKKVDEFIQNQAENMVFIYGEFDTWSATGVTLSVAAKKRGLRKFVYPAGHHDTRIRHFDKATQTEIMDIIKQWLEM